MQETSPERFQRYFLTRSPFRKSLEGWVLATMTATAVLFFAVELVFILSFTAPPLESQIVVLLLSLVAGSMLTVLAALAFWVVVVPVRWALSRSAWGLRSLATTRGTAVR